MQRQDSHVLRPDGYRGRADQDPGVGGQHQTARGGQRFGGVSDDADRNPPGSGAVDRIANAAAAAAFENATSVQAPTDIGLCSLKTRSMLRKRSGRPRSPINSAGEATPPTAAIHRASRTRRAIPARSRAADAMTAAAPAAPPTKRYEGISHVQTGAFSAGSP